MLLSSHDVWRRDFQVDEPTSLLDGTCKGNPFVPSKRKAMKPPWDGVRDINVAQLFEFWRPCPLGGGELFSFVNPIRQLECVKLVYLSASIEPFNVTKVSQSHPRAFSDAPRAARVNHFVCVGSG